jgi:hypothetical protein
MFVGLLQKRKCIWAKDKLKSEKTERYRFRDKNRTVVDENMCRLEVLTGAVMKSSIIWNTAPYRPLKINRRFGGTWPIHLRGWRIIQAKDLHESSSKPCKCWKNLPKGLTKVLWLLYVPPALAH